MPRKTLKDTRYALSDEEVKKALEVEREYKEKKKQTKAQRIVSFIWFISRTSETDCNEQDSGGTREQCLVQEHEDTKMKGGRIKISVHNASR